MHVYALKVSALLNKLTLGAASVVRIPFNSPNGKGRLNAYGVVVHAIMVGDVVVGGSYSTGKNVTGISIRFIGRVNVAVR